MLPGSLRVEIRRRSSVQCSLAPCEWKEHKINLLSATGYLEFLGEIWAALSVADSAILLVDATVGVEVGTEFRWRELEERGLPRFIYINKMDRENADFFRSLDMVQSRFRRRCVPLQLPLGAQANFRGVVSLLDAEAEVPVELQESVAKWREQLVETVAEADDELTEKYLEKGELSSEELLQGLKKGVASGSVVPVLAGSAVQNLGVREMLDGIVQLFPSPVERPPLKATNAGSKAEEVVHAQSEGALAALVFKTTADPYVGRLSYFRVFSGKLNSDSQVWNASRGQVERFGQLYVPWGKSQEPVSQLQAGDIGSVAKLANTGTGDTLASRDNPLLLPRPVFPEPVFSVAAFPKTKADVDKMAVALGRMCEEDPSLRYHRNQDASETILSGMGDVHIEVALEKTRRKFGVELLSQMPKIAFQETIATKTVAEYKHKKQTGGHGQFGHVTLEMEPLPRGSGVEFASRVVGGAVPREYIPAVEKGVIDSLQEGVVGQFPVVDVRVTLTDGSSHSVDSSNMAFQIAGSHAARKGLQQASPLILEPVYGVKVTVPDSATGDVVGDLNSKRGRVLGMYPENGLTAIEVEVPLAEIQHYAADLRSLTQGRGVYTMVFDHYDPIPSHLQQRLVEAAKST